MPPPHLLLCKCSETGLVDRTKLSAVTQALRESGIRLTEVDDLCALAANEPEKVAALAAEGPSVVACFPRTIRALFDWVGADGAATGVEVHNLRSESAAAVLAALGLSDGPPDESADDGGEAATPPSSAERGGGAWFPVIDPDRCTNCDQCRNFCLFDVYGKTDGGDIRVENPSACKPGCPACARICPAAAIIFPKYGNSPINGDELGDLADERERIRVDLDQALGANVYAALAERRRKRRKLALLRKPPPGTAE